MFFILLSILICETAAYPNGPPIGKSGMVTLCTDMFPTGHKANAQVSDSPYSILLGNTCYKAAQVVQGMCTNSSWTKYKLPGGGNWGPSCHKNSSVRGVMWSFQTPNVFSDPQMPQWLRYEKYIDSRVIWHRNYPDIGLKMNKAVIHWHIQSRLSKTDIWNSV